uniref:Uncharacterized protein n=1 Tax=Hucho hucho TaxID=62062 RepID=A0A4W5NUW2_9TELE
MDVRVYPPPPQSLSATDSSRLGPLQYPDSPYCNKYDSEAMFLGMPEAGLDFVPTNQFRVPPNPHQTHLSAKQTGPLWKRDGPAHSDGPRLPWVNTQQQIHHQWVSGLRHKAGTRQLMKVEILTRIKR